MSLLSAAGTSPEPGVSPVQPKERIEVMDVLRGFALFGILWVNMDAWFRPPWENGYDHVVYRLDDVFGNGRFASLFSFLFGLGFAVQMLRAETNGGRFFALHIRRMIVLFLIGLADGVLLFGADILKTYAFAGVCLLLFRRCSPRTLLIYAALGLSYVLVSGTVTESLARFRPVGSQVAAAGNQEAAVRQMDQQALDEGDIRDKSRGEYSEIVAKRARYYQRNMLRWQWYTDETNIWTLSLFLLGLYVGRRGILQHPEAHLPLLRNLVWLGLGLGLSHRLIWVAGQELTDNTGFYFTSVSPRYFTRVGGLMTLAYIAGITLLLRKASWRTRLKPLVWAGRMALTNYVMQSLITTVVFYGFGFGLYLYASASLNLALALTIWVAQILFSAWWLRRFQFGPLEWVWRSLTYAKLQPWRVA